MGPVLLGSQVEYGAERVSATLNWILTKMFVYITYTITYTCTGLGPDAYSVGVLPKRMVAYLEGMWTWKMGAKGLVGISTVGMMPIFEY